jgi:hypothetical protein
MYDSLGKAAAATGVSKSTILRAIRSHRVSASKTDTGDWQIDPAELHRVFPPVRNGDDRAADHAMTRGATAAEQLERAQTEAFERQIRTEIVHLQKLNDLMRAQLDDVRADRDHWRDTAQAVQRLLAPPRPWWRRFVA